jgi:calcium/proton exchanger cax
VRAWPSFPLAVGWGAPQNTLAEQVGEGIGGLLNATFGNAAELIIALMALSKGLTGVVKASLPARSSATFCWCGPVVFWPEAGSTRAEV